MKWSELYTELMLDTNEKTSIHKMFWMEERILLRILSDGVREYIGEEDGDALQVKILEIRRLRDAVLIRFDTAGNILPPGFRHGVYEVQARDKNNSGLYIKVPSEMLEDGNIPKSVRKSWPQMADSDDNLD